MQFNIVDFIKNYAKTRPNHLAFTFIDNHQHRYGLTYRELDQSVTATAQFLLSHSNPGERVILLYPQGIEYVKVFLACLYAGLIAVPFYPPRSTSNLNKIKNVILDCGATLALTNQNLFPSVGKLTDLPELSLLKILVVEEKTETESNTLDSPSNQSSPAFLQYTSGSTGNPKGVMVSHSNIIANLISLKQATKCTDEDIFCNWLPLFHDLGLVNTVLLPVYLGAHSILMSPVQFITRPLSWFKNISDFKATICGAPNFAFEHCNQKINDFSDESCDLSSWRVAFNAAEPIDPDTLRTFSKKFERIGFAQHAFYPSYGMAEATVFISGGDTRRNYETCRFSKSNLQNNIIIESQSQSDTQELVSCGQVQDRHSLVIVDPKLHRQLKKKQVGEIWFAGPSVALGYWGNNKETKRVFSVENKADGKRYLRTGDLGFIHQNKLYISGRIKDLLIIKGQNYQPQDLEKTCLQTSKAFRSGGTVAFTANDGELILIQELDRKMITDFDFSNACLLIRKHIFEEYDLLVNQIFITKSGQLPKTSSGKIQRSQCKHLFDEDKVERLYLSSNVSYTDLRAEYQRPVSESECFLCDLFSRLFEITNISINDSFFDLGGESITAIQLISEIRAQYNVAIETRDLFEYPEVTRLAQYIDGLDTESDRVAFISDWNSNKSLVSPGQKQLWFIDRIGNGSRHYQLNKLYRIQGGIEFTVLEKAFIATIQKHPVLHTDLLEFDGVLMSRIQDNWAWSLKGIDLQHCSKEDQDNQLKSHCQNYISRSFNLKKDLKLRAYLFTLSKNIHVLLVVAHHIAIDGWSEKILTQDIKDAYNNIKNNQFPNAEIAQYQYIDYAAYQQRWMKSDNYFKQLNFWKNTLTELPEIHSLPLDFPRPAKQSHIGGCYSQQLDSSLVIGLQQIAHDNNATLFMVFHAIFALLIHRYSGENDVAIGIPVSGRDRKETHKILGYFVNSLVLRSQLTDDLRFRGHLQRSKQTIIGALENQQLAFSELLKELNIEQNLSNHPLIQIMLNYSTQPTSTLAFPGTDTQELLQASGRSQFDLTLNIEREANGCSLYWEYASELFLPATIKRMAFHFERLLKGVITDSSSLCATIPLLSEHETTVLLEDWNTKTNDFDAYKPIHRYIEEQVLRSPDAVALVHKSQVLNYNSLNKKANQLARHLLTKNVKANDLVGLYLEPSFDFIIGLLAILKTGAAYIPIDPLYPSVRVQYMLSDTALSLVLSHSNTKKYIEQSNCEILELDNPIYTDLWNNNSTENIDTPNLSEHALAYVIYTSGSTGQPKGAKVFQKGVVNLIQWYTKTCLLKPSDCVLLLSSIGFDLTQKNFFGPLFIGAQLIIPEKKIYDPVYLTNLIADKKVSWVNCAPSAFYPLIETDNTQKITSLNTVVLGGENIDIERISVWMKSNNCKFINSYGPTECTDVTAFHSIIKSGEYANGIVPIGKPVANTCAYILDEHHTPVPIGVAGELYIGGLCVGDGYVNDDDLTASKFLPDPFAMNKSSRMYKSGDWARWLVHGEIEFIGRIDHQIKIRGFRVELAEINRQLLSRDDVKNCFLQILPNGTGDDQIVAYLITKTNQTTEKVTVSLKNYLKQYLPVYMIPAVFIFLEEFPLTPNGKVDRKSLPKPDNNFITDNTGRPPTTGTEKLLCEIWSEVLQHSINRIDVNFFRIGGHSLTAVQIASKISKSFNRELEVSVVFSAPTIAELAAIIDKTEPVRKYLPLQRKSGDQPTPLSPSQRQLWFLHQLQNSDYTYNMPVGFRISGELNIEALQNSFQTVINRHEAFRTYFTIIESGPVQVVEKNITFLLNLLPVTEEEVDERIQAFSKYHFDLSKPPLLRALLLQLSSSCFVLAINIHHIIADEWSLGLVVNELNKYYQIYANNETINVFPNEYQYADYTQWQHSILSRERIDGLASYWKSQLSHLPTILDFPTDNPRPSVRNEKAAHLSINLSGKVAKGIKCLAQKQNTTVFTVLLTAYQLLLSKYSRQEDIIVGTPVANRPLAELESIVGIFVNTLAIRTHVSKNISFYDLLDQVKQTTMEAFTHQDLPFDILVDALNPERSLSYSPIFQTMFVLQNNPFEALSLGDLSIEKIDWLLPSNKYDLTLFLTDSEGKISGYLEYAKELFRPETMQRFIRNFETLINSILENPTRPVHSLNILHAKEKKILLQTWNQTKHVTSTKSSIHQLFEEQVRKTPELLALHHPTELLTYEELDERADRLANHLIHFGFKPGDIAGIYLHRTPLLIISILAVMKCGGVYVPLDPNYPQKRNHSIIIDADLAFLISQKLLAQDGIINLGHHAVIIADNIHDQSAELNDKVVSANQSNELAYILYTSGSSGKPKGVEIKHSSALAMIGWANNTFTRKELSRVFASTSICFDLSVFEIFVPLSIGGTVVLGNNALDLLNWNESEKITLLNTVPSAFRELLNSGIKLPESLSVVNLAGEALPLELAKKGYESDHIEKIYNLYGPSEDTTYSTFYLVPKNSNRPPSIGKPIDNTQLYILDEALQPAPIGVSGEIHLAGSGLAKGYFKNKALTDEKFIRNPFCDSSMARMYKTGDLAKYRSDGNIEYLGRIDFQVKLRGFRVELGEIETLLSSNSQISEAIVQVEEMGINNQVLVAYLISNPDCQLNKEKVTFSLESRLPDFMIPAKFIEIAQFPMTPNGKIDRSALSWEKYENPGKTHETRILTNTESSLQDIWTDILELTSIDLHDNFFSIGGHSLLAIRVITAIKSRLGINIDLQQFFSSPTINALAKHIDKSEKLVDSFFISPRQGMIEHELSFTQQRIWVLKQFEGTASVYNLFRCFRFRGNLEVSVFEESINYLIHRHESLRTSFRTIDSKPNIKIDEEVNWHVVRHNTLGKKSISQWALAQSLFEFDLERAPLLRVCVLEVAENDHLVHFNMHHIIADGWSIAIFVREFMVVYQSIVNKREIILDELSIQYSDFGHHERICYNEGKYNLQLDYWKKQLDKLPPIHSLCLDKPRFSLQSYNGKTIRHNFGETLSSRLKAFSAEYSVTLFMFLQSAFSVLLHRFSGNLNSDIVMGTPVANRPYEQLSSVIGCFINTVVLRSNIEDSEYFLQHLKASKRTILNAFSNQSIPFEQLISALQPERSTNHHPLFQILISFHNYEVKELALPGINLESIEVESGLSKFDLTLNIHEQENIILTEWEFNCDLFNQESIAQLAQSFETMLESILDNPFLTVGEVSLLHSSEINELLYTQNDTEQTLSGDCFHEAFEREVERSPDSIAVTYGNQSLNYLDLNNRINQLAHYLLQSGVNSTFKIGILLDRSIDLIVSLMAVQKTGAAYIPFDPGYPEFRLGYMAADAEINLIISTNNLLPLFSFPKNYQTICLDENFEKILSQSTDNLGLPIGESQSLYTIYTSGTSGNPKGITISHGNLSNFLHSVHDTPGFSDTDRLLAVTPYSFDIAGLEFYLPLYSGGHLVLCSQEDLLDATHIIELLDTQDITVMQATPVTWHLLIEGGWQGKSNLKALCGGEAVPSSLVKRLLPKVESLWNMYGPTETTIWSSVSHIENDQQPIYIGLPMANTQMYILDTHLNPVPLSVPGTMYISGRGVSKGYLNRQTEMDLQFAPNPFLPNSRHLLYNTGDRARYSAADKKIQYLGRNDKQIKLRGFRIEPDEIERVFLQHKLVRDCVVILKERKKIHGHVSEYLCVYYESVKPIDQLEIRNFLAKNLPEYMVPSRFVWLHSIPLTPSGKKDRNALPEPENTTVGEANNIVSPESEMEVLLSTIWQEILELDKVGVNQNFFDLGASSMEIVQAAGVLSERLDKEISAIKLFSYPTISSFSQYLLDNEKLTPDSNRSALLKKGRDRLKQQLGMRN